jgi:hypothetical protein
MNRHRLLVLGEYTAKKGSIYSYFKLRRPTWNLRRAGRAKVSSAFAGHLAGTLSGRPPGFETEECVQSLCQPIILDSRRHSV